MVPIEAFVLGLFIGGVLGAWVVMMGTMAGFDGVVHMPDESPADEDFESDQQRQRARLNSVAGNGHVREKIT